jgi:hypothetical protein
MLAHAQRRPSFDRRPTKPGGRCLNTRSLTSAVTISAAIAALATAPAALASPSGSGQYVSYHTNEWAYNSGTHGTSRHDLTIGWGWNANSGFSGCAATDLHDTGGGGGYYPASPGSTCWDGIETWDTVDYGGPWPGYGRIWNRGAAECPYCYEPLSAKQRWN